MNKKLWNVDEQRGNALIYVLIAIALFAGLGFTLTRQARNTGTTEIDDAKSELYAMQLITYASQTKSVIDQMIFTGSTIDDLDFIEPADAGFNTAPHIHKIYHPQGGGLTPATLPDDVISQITTPPDAGWYMGRFNNIEWTDTNGTDVILTAYQISRTACETINEKITGTTTIPALTGDMDDYLLDTATNNDLTAAACAACDGYTSLCVSNSAATAYSYYSVIIDR